MSAEMRAVLAAGACAVLPSDALHPMRHARRVHCRVQKSRFRKGRTFIAYYPRVTLPYEKPLATCGRRDFCVGDSYPYRNRASRRARESDGRPQYVRWKGCARLLHRSGAERSIVRTRVAEHRCRALQCVATRKTVEAVRDCSKWESPIRVQYRGERQLRHWRLHL